MRHIRLHGHKIGLKKMHSSTTLPDMRRPEFAMKVMLVYLCNGDGVITFDNTVNGLSF